MMDVIESGTGCLKSRIELQRVEECDPRYSSGQAQGTMIVAV